MPMKIVVCKTEHLYNS